MKKTISMLLIASLVAAEPAFAVMPKMRLPPQLQNAIDEFMQPGSVVVPATGEVEVAFSPNEGAEALVVKAIDAARSQIRMLSYSFTSAPVVAALVRARKRGVDVALLVDYRNNISEDRSGKARAALDTITNAGITARTISVYPIHHDKTIIVDGRHVETGSFNYSKAAAQKNSENVIVLWNNPQLAAVYLKHWERNWKDGKDYRSNY